MIRLASAFVFLILYIFCCRSDSQVASNIMKFNPSSSFREILAINDGPSTNYYFTLFLITIFPETYALEHIMHTINACRKSPFSSEDVKRKCRRFKSAVMRRNCQIALEAFYTPYRPCFFQEETDRKSLRQSGVIIINEGEHGTDLLHILNRIRGGRMKDENEIMYYIRRIYLYADISLNGWKLLLTAADIFILDEWRALNVGPDVTT